jgi:hypothetical protein
MYTHALLEERSQANKNEMQNVHVVSKTKFNVLSNGALVFPVSPRLCRGKWREHFAESDLAFCNLQFLAHRTTLTGKPSAPFERA